MEPPDIRGVALHKPLINSLKAIRRNDCGRASLRQRPHITATKTMRATKINLTTTRSRPGNAAPSFKPGGKTPSLADAAAGTKERKGDRGRTHATRENASVSRRSCALGVSFIST